MVVQVSGTGTLLLTGTNTFQGGARITGTGTLQVGNGGTTGSLDSGNGLTPVVNSTAAGAFIQNRSDSVTTNLAINGPVNVTKLGTGSLTLTGSQFHTGTTTVGDGLVASKLVVNGALVAQASTTTNASIVATTANYRTSAPVELARPPTSTPSPARTSSPCSVPASSPRAAPP
jgi:autotransporter-associated beta strand protein